MSSKGEKLRAEKKRGEDAGYIVGHPLFIESIDTLKENILRQWRDSPARDTEGREKLFQMYRLTEAIKGHLVSVLQTGKMAESELSADEMRDRAR